MVCANGSCLHSGCQQQHAWSARGACKLLNESKGGLCALQRGRARWLVSKVQSDDLHQLSRRGGYEKARIRLARTQAHEE